MVNLGSKHNVTLPQNRELFVFDDLNCNLQGPQNVPINGGPYVQESYAQIKIIIWFLDSWDAY